MYTPDGREKRKYFEPFMGWGVEADIRTTDQAKQVIKGNLYYLYFYASLLLAVSLFGFYINVENDLNKYATLALSVFYFGTSLGLKFSMSRAAAVLTIVVFSLQVVQNLIYSELSGVKLILIMFIFSSMLRCVKATFAYHKLERESNV